MPRPRHNKKLNPAPITSLEFVGCQMANMLYAMTNDPCVPADLRVKADQLRQKWDRITNSLCYRINNPIVMAQLEDKFFPREKA